MSKTDIAQHHTRRTTEPKNIVIPLYPGMEILDVAGPASVFTEANNQAGYAHYKLHYLCLQDGGHITSAAALQLKGVPYRRMPRRIHTLLVPGAAQVPLEQALQDKLLLQAIQRLARRCERLASVCSGAFLLAEAGLTKNLRVTTHWAGIQQLRDRYPDTDVTSDGLYTRDGHVWSSAGVLAGVDMALAIVQNDLDASAALNIARNLVVYLVRNGDQTQFSGALDLQTQSRDHRLTELVGWLQANLNKPVGVTDMAARLSVSERSLHRLCRSAFDKTPGRLLTDLRLELARELLQQGAMPLKQLAGECGFATPSALSKAFTQKFGISPNRYRWQFRIDAA